MSSGLPWWRGQGKPPTRAVFVCRSSFGGPVGIPILLSILPSSPLPRLPRRSWAVGSGRAPPAGMVLALLRSWPPALRVGRAGARVSPLEASRQGLKISVPPSPLPVLSGAALELPW